MRVSNRSVFIHAKGGLHKCDYTVPVCATVEEAIEVLGSSQIVDIINHELQRRRRAEALEELHNRVAKREKLPGVIRFIE